MNDQSNGPPRSQKCDCLRLTAIAISSNTLTRTARRGVSSHPLTNMNHDSSSSSNIWYGKFIRFQSRFTDCVFQSQSSFISIFF